MWRRWCQKVGREKTEWEVEEEKGDVEKEGKKGWRWRYGRWKKVEERNETVEEEKAIEGTETRRGKGANGKM